MNEKLNKKVPIQRVGAKCLDEVKSEWWIDKETKRWMLQDKDSGVSAVGPSGPPGKKGNDGKDGRDPDVLVVKTIQELRDLYSESIAKLEDGSYKGVQVLGYYEEGDTPAPITYYLTNTVEEDNGGSIIQVSDIKVEHKFQGLINPVYFGASPELEDNMPIFLKANDIGQGLEITNGTYRVTLTEPNPIKPKSNTSVIGSNAVIKVNPNDLLGYSVFTFNGVRNCDILGIEIVGDKHEHTGVGGEWGMGITVTNGCDNIRIYNTKISSCWGDGIYIGGATGTGLNTNIQIHNVISDDNRRQGLSVTHVNGLYVTESFFINTAGVPPQDGIDLEPNRDQEVRNVYLTNVTCNGNANAGLSVYNEQRENALLEDIHLVGCNFENNLSLGVRFMYMKYSTIKKCYFRNNFSFGLEIPRDVKGLYFTDCEFTKNGSHGVSLVTTGQELGVDNIIFTKCKFNDNGTRVVADGFKLDKLDATQTIKDVKFYNCDFSRNDANSQQRYGISTKTTVDSTISGVTLYDATYVGNTSGARSGIFPLVFVDSNRAQLLSGTTGNRPTSNIRTGQVYFDTTLSKNIIWNGTAWVDSIPEASLSYLGTVKKSSNVVNSTTVLPIADTASAATDVATLLVDHNDLVAKYNSLLTVVAEVQGKLNSKLNADRVSGQQATT